ncbi:hypothetical protein GCM10011346_10010 [Oceanobacillus neutriphilus]|uniref:Uncharacterized protein n=2 Tax=Oceanobacillus neutriphilus TaxID=531815 RepID=A0ABQ2NR30_9BACI|nr:hypothetical protein GCM10011346_10010 [Oceanobacillus neutriphilus]
MLLEYKINTTNEAINIIKNKFYVTDKIAKKRVIHFENQLEWSKIYCKLTNSI